MDELVKLVVQKTGLPEATAKNVVQIVVDYLKKKMPEPMRGQVDTLLAGGKLGEMEKTVGGILGKK